MHHINFDKNKFAVIGLGDTGMSIIRYLEYCKADIVKLFDTRDDPPSNELLNTYRSKCKFGPLNYSDFIGVDVVVLSPGVSVYNPTIKNLIDDGITVVGDIELFGLAIKNWEAKVIGITGSNGKTTVTSLTGYMATKLGYETLIAGNIGVPVLDAYLEIIATKNIPQVIVLELSSFQLETCYTLGLDVATVLNISEDHLDRYCSLIEYAYTKSKIFSLAKSQVLNFNDELVMSMYQQLKPTIYLKEHTTPDCLDNWSILEKSIRIFNGYEISFDDINLIGRHNYFNVLAGVALLYSVGLIEVDKVPQIKTILHEFTGLDHRMQQVAIYDNIKFINDSKATNVGAVCAGISGINCDIHLILGGDGKGQDFHPLYKLVQDKCKSVAIIGKDKYIINDVLNKVNVPIKLFDSLELAIEFCIDNAKSGDAVVLSPACASWDMFDNYKHRARVFTEYINNRFKNLKK